MASRPTTELDWGGVAVEPSGGAKAAGFSPGDRVPAEWWNHHLQLIDAWLKYIAGDDHEFLQAIPQLSSSTPVISSPQTAHDHPSSSANKFKLQLQAKLHTNTFVRLYSGDESAAPGGYWALTWNAVFDVSSGGQSWSKDDTGKVSLALICDSAGLNWRQRAAGAGTFTTWTAGEGDIFVGGDVSVGGDLTVTGSAGALNVATLDAVGDVYAGDDVIAENEFQYGTPPSRTTMLPLATMQVEGGDFTIAAGRHQAGNSGVTFQVPIKLPAGAVLDAVQVIYNQAGASPVIVQAVQGAGANWGSGVVPVGSVVDVDTGNTSTGLHVVTVNFGGLTVDNEDEEYSLWVTTGQSGDEVHAARLVSWVDPGPRGH